MWSLTLNWMREAPAGSCVVPRDQQGATPPAAQSDCIWIYHLSELFPGEFMVSVAGFKSSSTQPDVHLVNYGPV